MDQLTSALVWMSSGGTKSVVHYDDADNLNCLISGQKRMGELQVRLRCWISMLCITPKPRAGVSVVFWSPELKDAIEDPKMGWINHDNNPQNEYATYGRYAGGVGKF
jgi:hypothetical protein